LFACALTLAALFRTLCCCGFVLPKIILLIFWSILDDSLPNFARPDLFVGGGVPGRWDMDGRWATDVYRTLFERSAVGDSNGVLLFLLFLLFLLLLFGFRVLIFADNYSIFRLLSTG
jgi:hypothetical protein